MIPYNWRPSTLWYKFSCWAWYRHTTKKPRYLPHTFVDKTTLVPHMMFELLSEFLEKECSPGIVDWTHCTHSVGERTFNVLEEMQELNEWWHEVYHKQYPLRVENLWGDYDFTHNDAVIDKINRLEDIMEQELYARLHRLVDIIPFMWT